MVARLQIIFIANYPTPFSLLGTSPPTPIPVPRIAETMHRGRISTDAEQINF